MTFADWISVGIDGGKEMIKLSDCDYCKHCHELKNGSVTCDAFPNGIPYDHMDKDLKETSECNNGIGYEPKE